MTYDYSQTYRESKDVLNFHHYRMSPVHQAILDQEVWAILKVDERAGREFFTSAPILELGIGGGAIVNNLGVKLQNSNLIGVDVSRKMIETCKTKLSHSSQVGGASIIVGDIFRLPFRQSSLNSVITVRLIPNLVKNGLALKEVARILKPDGQVIFDIYNRMSVMSLLDSVLNLFLRCKVKPYKHIGSLNQMVKICESAELQVTSHVKCLLLTEVLFKFVPGKLLHIAMVVDRIVSNLPLFSKISTRVFILARKRRE